jgi:CheY-like chemotaxis protein
MDNQERRQEIKRLATTPSGDSLQLLSDALHSPITLCTALSALKTIGTPEALGVIQDFGSQNGFTSLEMDQLLQSLSDNLFNRAAKMIYQRYDEFPLPLLAIWSSMMNERILADFEHWRGQQSHSMTTVFHIDDAPQALQVFRLMINIQGDMISLGTAKNATEGAALAQPLQPDVIILDHMLPGLGGIEALDYIHGLLPASKIIFHSYRAYEPELKKEALEHGAERVEIYGAMLAKDLGNMIRSTMGQPVE